MREDKNRKLHRDDGTFAGAKEAFAWTRGKAVGFMQGLAQGTARGVSMAASAVGMGVERMWSAIRGNSKREKVE